MISHLPFLLCAQAGRVVLERGDRGRSCAKKSIYWPVQYRHALKLLCFYAFLFESLKVVIGSKDCLGS
jgi:hypothetical protein